MVRARAAESWGLRPPPTRADSFVTSKQGLLDPNGVLGEDGVIQMQFDGVDFASWQFSFDLDSILAAARGYAACACESLKHRHAGFDPIAAGCPHFAGDVELLGARHEDLVT